MQTEASTTRTLVVICRARGLTSEAYAHPWGQANRNR